MGPRRSPPRVAVRRPTPSSRRPSRSSRRRGPSCTFGAARPCWRPRASLRRIVGALDGKTAIVTGASSGIGAATAAALAREGARVAGGARRVERLETDAKLEVDVTDPKSCESFVDAAIAELGGLDILVNGARLGLGRDPFWKGTEEDE